MFQGKRTVNDIPPGLYDLFAFKIGCLVVVSMCCSRTWPAMFIAGRRQQCWSLQRSNASAGVEVQISVEVTTHGWCIDLQMG